MNVAICPKCDKGTRRQYLYGSTTCMNIPQTYDERGNLIPSPIQNKTTNTWKCLECGEVYND